MNRVYRTLTINPGSTSTKLALFDNEELRFKQNIYHNDYELNRHDKVWDQYSFRKKEILQILKEKRVELKELDCVVGRGGLFRPILSGTYQINQAMLNDARKAVQGEHASNLGCVLAYGIAWDYNIPSFIVDPPSVDEMIDEARLSGHVRVKRRSLLHALNIKAMSRLAAKQLKRSLEDINLIVAHLGGGISITPLLKGRMIDTSNALSGGPFSAERTGSLPMMDFVDEIMNNKMTKKDIKKMLVGQGGMFSYLKTKSMIDVTELYEKGEPRAQMVMKAMAYQISKEIGAMAAVLKGDINAVVLTGGAANSAILIKLIKERIAFLGKIVVLPGEDELKALALGALRVLKKEEKPLIYPQQIRFDNPFEEAQS